MSSRPERPAFRPYPLLLSAPVRAPSARARVAGFAESQLGSGCRLLSTGGPRRVGAPVLGGSSRPPHSNFAVTRVRFSPRHGSEPRAGGNGGTFWHRLSPPAGSPMLGTLVPGELVHLPILNFKLSSVPSSPAVWHL